MMTFAQFMQQAGVIAVGIILGVVGTMFPLVALGALLKRPKPTPDLRSVFVAPKEPLK